MPRTPKSRKIRKATRRGFSKYTPAKARIPTQSVRNPHWVYRKGPERKRLVGTDVQIPVATLASFSPPGSMNLLATGTAISNRIGNQVKYKYLEIRWTYYPGEPTTDITPNSQIRIVILYDKQTKGAEPLIGDIFAGLAKFNDFIRPDQAADRFIILYDRISQMSGASDDADRMLPVSGVIKLPVDLQTMYTGNAADIAAVLAGGISITVAGNAQNVTTSSIFVFSGLLEFTDE
jgi:hypothetical protein